MFSDVRQTVIKRRKKNLKLILKTQQWFRYAENRKYSVDFRSIEEYTGIYRSIQTVKHAWAKGRHTSAGQCVVVNTTKMDNAYMRTSALHQGLVN